ncbi:MAG: hypothetical protein U9R39_01885 [Campylobacterota bacterium]|nr:hypothetical protein [Campylobacterota bacterium]
MKKENDVRIIDSKAIRTLSQKVTQEIDSKYLLEFIKTSILNSNISTNKNTKYYYKFLESSLSYEILIFQSDNPNRFILEPFVFLAYYDENKTINSVDIFITNGTFVLFKNQELLMMKNVDNVSNEDIKIYVYQTYNIKIDNFIQIDKETLKQLKSKYLLNNYKKSDIEFHKMIENKSFSFFIMFLVITTLLSFYIIYNKSSGSKSSTTNKLTQSTKVKNHFTKLEKIYNKHNLKNINKTIELFKYLKLQHITLETFEYKNNKIYANIVDKQKKKLLNFITIYTEEVKINSIVFDETDETFIMDIEITI